MALFGLGKKKEEEKSSCCCGGGCNAEAIEEAVEVNKQGASIKVLGSGCAKCHQLEENVKKALEQMGMDTTIDHVTDFSQIAAYGVMTTPALVVDGKVVSYGKVLKVEEAVKLLEKVRS
ncbi:MAG: thioredoxin family protein [Lachnospiraceae bacterium]|nr:thioredoxin family protein [Lachnospiraceae bacterium]